MKRSEVNRILRDGDEMIRRHGFTLPPFARWSADEIRTRPDAARIREARLGWDITDYGQG
ncbi:MAG: D-lyxose/D-mannose family sugar isomerase, partial [Rhodobacteraceae bacterium]|nr:D-lyxose/D-mannose family sugar isomerase [Paracoccaceae bacterium]